MATRGKSYLVKGEALCSCSWDASTEEPKCLGCAKYRTQDPINHPSHYVHGKYELLDVLDDWKLDYYLGNVLKYICRHNHKGNPLEDLKKARFYLDRRIKHEEEANEVDSL